VTHSQDPPQTADPQTRERRERDSRLLSIIGFVCAAVALVLIPILFGLAGIVLGIVGHTRGEPLGKWAAFASLGGMVVGTFLSALASHILTF
jgi:hypothetical protein